MPETTAPEAGAETTPETPPAPKAGDRTFTQEEVDRVVGERLARERTKFSDYDDLKSKASKLDEIEAASQSDLEREREAREAAETTAAEATERANDTLRRAAIVAEASRQGAQDPDAVVALLRERGFKIASGDDEVEVAIGKDNTVAGAKETVAALLAEKKYLLGEAPTPDFDGGARPPAPEPKKPEDAHNEFILGITGHLNK